MLFFQKSLRSFFRIIVFMGFVFLYFQGKAYADDWQVWSTGVVKFDIKEKTDLRLEQEFRLGNDVKKLVEEHSDIGLGYKARKWLHWAVHYRYIEREKNDLWEYEQRPHLNCTLSGDWKGLVISDRNRIEYRMMSKTKDSWRYRNKIRIKRPIPIKKAEISPYIDDEFVVDFDQNYHNFNRLSVGFEFGITKNSDGDIYFLWQDQCSRGSEEPTYVFGAQISLDF